MSERCRFRLSGRHFWTAWHMTAERRAERSCNYCGLTEVEGETDE